MTLHYRDIDGDVWEREGDTLTIVHAKSEYAIVGDEAPFGMVQEHHGPLEELQDWKVKA